MMFTRRKFAKQLVRALGLFAVSPLRTRAQPMKPAPAREHVHGKPIPKRLVPVAVPNPLHPEQLARFVDPLPIPRTTQPSGTRPDPHDKRKQIPFYEVSMRAAKVRIHRDVPESTMFSYGGSVPGPTFDVRAGQPLLVAWSNDLPNEHLLPIDHNLCGAEASNPDVRAIVHVHGARVPPSSDGYPDDWYPPGKSLTTYYPNAQEATTLWYHDHAMGIERLNQYAGLFGMWLIRDDVEDKLGLPRGKYELPLVLCDRIFDADGALRYPESGDANAPWVPEVYGDAQLINGKLFPYLDVEPTRYRFRLVNASNARFYYLSLSNGMLTQIGSDQGLLSAPVSLKQLTLAPGERADVLVDFSAFAGSKIALRNQTSELLQFRVADGPASSAPMPIKLRPVTRTPASSAIKTRRLTLDEYMDPRTHQMLMLLNASYWRDPVTEQPELGSTEIWELMNLTDDTHPIHLHLVRFQILSQQRFDMDEYNVTGRLQRIGEPISPEANEAGWKDTVRVGPGMITRIIIRFEGYVGRYVWHCHVLEHAANEMMRPFEVVPRRKSTRT